MVQIHTPDPRGRQLLVVLSETIRLLQKTFLLKFEKPFVRNFTMTNHLPVRASEDEGKVADDLLWLDDAPDDAVTSLSTEVEPLSSAGS